MIGKRKNKIVTESGRIINIESEKVFDMLPYVSRMYKKLDFEKITNAYVGKKNPEEAGLNVIAIILEDSPKVKEEFFGIVAIYSDITVEEAKKRPFRETVEAIKEIFSDKEAIDFFKQAMQ